MQTFSDEERSVFSDFAAATVEAGHPGFHLSSPAHFMIDCWGGVKLDGYYHMFMDVGPERGDCPANTVFAHARSRDLLHWEHLPFPMLPDETELRTNDGWIGLNGNGEPTLLYTSVPNVSGVPRCHRAAVGSADLVHFTRLPGPAFMTLENHGGPDYGWGWSDPYVFRANGKQYLLMSKCVDKNGKASLPVYEATDGTLTHWRYKGIFFDNNGEVVNFFPLGDKWVLIYSPYQSIEYFIGDLDFESMRYNPIAHGILSYGYHSQEKPVDRGFYATCVYPEEAILCGWISGFTSTKLWNGCMGVPRKLSLTPDFRLCQAPIEGLKTLRGKQQILSGKGTVSAMSDWEINVPDTLSLNVGKHLSVCIADGKLTVNEDTYPLSGEIRYLRMLLDRDVCELFLGSDEHACFHAATACFPYEGEILSAEVSSEAAVWQMHEAPTTLSDSLAQFR